MVKMNGETLMTDAAGFVVMSGAYLQLLKKKSRRRSRRRWWMVSLNQSRERYSGIHMMADLLKEPSGRFENRMSFEDFEELLQKIEPVISKKDTRWRKAIPGKERLALTLRFLASGDSFKSLHYLFKISAQLISSIVPEVCSALIKVLSNVIQIPSNESEWKNIAKQFENIWNFPHCIGSMDGKHITIQAPINSGSEFYNYKQYFSVVLMALVDADYNFIFADCGCQGRLSDGAVFRNTELFKNIENNGLHCPSDEPLPGRNIPIPDLFVDDDAFGLCKQIMKPYPGLHEKGSKERTFNYRLSRARRVVENVFGIMASTFRVLRKPMLLQPEKVSLIVMTCVLLHNFLRKSRSSRSNYSPPGTFDSEEDGNITPGAWRQNQDNMSSLLPLRNIPRKPSMEARTIRNELAEYFMSNGRVSWQDIYC
ncbi:unnamed protein product [Acanthoscelides obtectus]|uniref:DDE Tnp4 domain-containing protein n=2 Tax=Acanthoscelides obtectus TaxID=200917 RepID=A0A9P0PV86_ACAOB|nr:unnamed protein product [Acanthoscelides obtectus]CAK1673397.1 Protein ALP1-like [Acanthoscelides obtectus]